MTARAQRPDGGSRGQAQGSRGPFSRVVDVRRLPDTGLTSQVEATPAECAALAAAMDLPAIASLVGRFELRRRAGGRVAVNGEVSAEVSQLCVVTLESFVSRVTQPIDLLFAPAVIPEADGQGRSPDRRKRQAPDHQLADRRQSAAGAPVPGSDDQADPPDPLIDDAIDLGAVAAEFVALALDPYPRKPGVSFDDMVEAPEADEPSAFAALERLKARP